MIAKAIVQLDPPVRRRFDQMNAAARRLSLELESAIGRALVQAQTAMNASNGGKAWRISSRP
jgi:hypothetical protein